VLSYTGANRIKFFNESTGYVATGGASGQGSVKKTTNGGVNWSTVQTTYGVFDIHFVDINTGYGVGSSRSIIKTTNAGQTWESLNSGLGWLNSVFFLDVNTGFAVGSYSSWPVQHSLVLKTTNSGTSWSVQETNWGTGNSVYFVNYNTGYIACGYSETQGFLYKTTDSGNNWISQEMGFPYELTQVQFIGENTGFASGFHGKFIKTTNGGMNWFETYYVTESNFWSMHFVNQNVGYLSGSGGVLLKTTNGGGALVSVSEILNSSIPQTYTLHQNYPNPFNPVTKIKFDIPKSGFVKIIIYDLLGREITQLVNQQMHAGSYNADWDAANYPSGVYFYKLVAGDFVETKKMVLVK